jgi:hypothetical protein
MSPELPRPVAAIEIVECGITLQLAETTIFLTWLGEQGNLVALLGHLALRSSPNLLSSLLIPLSRHSNLVIDAMGNDMLRSVVVGVEQRDAWGKYS